jgi:hypothetical protein
MRTGGKDLLLDNPIAVGAIDFVNYMNWGQAVEAALAWMPGSDVCGQID